jgi:hypothetical protein
MPLHAVRKDLEEGRLSVLPIEDVPPDGLILPMSAVWQTKSPPGPAGRWFIDRLKQIPVETGKVPKEVGGGVLLILGFRAREVASGLAVFTLATAIFFHHDFADRNQMIHFLKNIMIIGGLLQISHFGTGRHSVDAQRSRDPQNVAGASV